MSTDLSTGELPTEMRLDELLFHGALCVSIWAASYPGLG